MTQSLVQNAHHIEGLDVMTLKQLEQKVNDLEQQMADLRDEIKPMRPLPDIQQTFGMFANGPDFDEIVRLGRENRQQDEVAEDK